MIHSARRFVLFAACLSVLAGFIDALGFISLGGVFLSFMSGNSTRFAVSAAEAGNFGWFVPVAVIITFVSGVIAGSLLGRRMKRVREPAIISFIFSLLLLAACLNAFGYFPAAIACMAFAMGAANTIFERDGEVKVGVTYMTGTLVKIGQKIAAFFAGESATGLGHYFLLWLGFFIGAAGGAYAYHCLGFTSLWAGVAWSLLLTIVAVKIFPRHSVA